MIRLLVAHGAPESGIFAALYLDDAKKVKSLLKESPDLVHSTDDAGMTPLHRAAENGQRAMVEVLVAHGANVGARAKDGQTVLQRARNKETLDTILSYAPGEGKDIFLATLTGDLEAVRSLVSSDPSLVNAVAGKTDVYALVNGATPLHHGVFSGNLELVRFLVEKGANPDAKDGVFNFPPQGWSPVPYRLDIAELLRDRAGLDQLEKEEIKVQMQTIVVGDLDEGEKRATAYLKRAEKEGTKKNLAMAYSIKGFVAYYLGDWSRAREFTDRSIAVWDGPGWAMLQRALLEYEVGNFDRGSIYMERFLEKAPAYESKAVNATKATALVWIARITGDNARLDEAEEGARSRLLSTAYLPGNILIRTILGYIEVQRGDAAAAEEHYSALKPARGLNLGPFSHLNIDWILGLLAQTMGRLDDAMVHFEDVLAFFRKGGFRPALAWICHDYSDALLHRNGPGDRDRARSLLDESLALSHELGMRPLMERVMTRMKSSGT